MVRGLPALSALGRWPHLVAVFALLNAVCCAGEPSQLLQALDAAASEDAARQIMEPHLENLKSLEKEAVEKVVLRQWWGLAREIVARSHDQQVDLSFSVRKAIKSLKDEADELLRTLNPKYGVAQQVNPAFQWAQNDTCVFLTIKYTVRWNAPGALEVTEPSVNISDNMFNFSGLGKHSNNKYKYVLNLDLFDRLSVTQSTWSMASVGKMSATLRKKWARKWPRLLSNKKMKIGNMHVWMEMQEKLDGSLSGMSSATNSPITCLQSEKLYCLPTDTCKKAVNCTTCPGKNNAHEEEGICTGMPSEKAGVSFKDTDMNAGEVGGDVKITKARNEFDIDSYVLFWGKDDHTVLENADGSKAEIGQARPTGFDTEVQIPANTPIPEAATHILVFSRNLFGEYPSPGSTLLRDAVLPKGKPGAITFDDEDGEKGELSGPVRIARAADEDKLDDYSLHWGRSATRKTSSGSLIRDISKGSGTGDVTHTISKSTKPPDGATHLLVFAKNEHGENPSPSSLKFVDNTKSCLSPTDADCVSAVAVTPDEDPSKGIVKATITVEPAMDASNVTSYVLYWGKAACESGLPVPAGAKMGIIKDLPVGTSLEHQLADARMPSNAAHILAFSKNKYGESQFCTSVSFKDEVAATPSGEEKREDL